MEHKDNRHPSNVKSNISIGDEYYFITIMYKFVNNAILEFMKNSIEWAPLKMTLIENLWYQRNVLKSKTEPGCQKLVKQSKETWLVVRDTWVGSASLTIL